MVDGTNMNDDPAGHSLSGQHYKPLSKTVHLNVLSESEESSDDEPPGRLRLDQALLENSNTLARRRNGASNGRSRSSVNGSDHGGGHGFANGHRSGVALLDAPPGNDATPQNTRLIDSADDFVIGRKSQALRERAFPDASDAQWNDWKWQLRCRIKDLDGLGRVLNLSEQERAAVAQLGGHLPVGITPYYASLLDPENPVQGLRKTMVPLPSEFITTRGEE